MQLVQGGCFQPDCAAPLGRRRLAQKPALHFWRRHSALRVYRLRPVQTIGEYARKRTRACGRRRLRTELVRTAVRSRQGVRRRAGTSAAPGLPSESGRRSRSGGGRLGCLGRGRLPADFSGWRSAGALAADPAFREEGLPVFPASACRAALGEARCRYRAAAKAPAGSGAGKRRKKISLRHGFRKAPRRAIQGCSVPLGPRFGRLRAASAAEERFPARKRALF